MTKTITAIIGDLHIGGSTALAPPTFQIHTRSPKETQTVTHSPLQAWVWECWTDYWGYVRKLIGGKRKTNRLVVVCMGDVIEGIHHNTPQVMNEKVDQIKAAIDVLTPVRDMADAFYGILGTGTHAGVAATDETGIYEALSATEFGQQLSVSLDGYIHDFAHHPGGAARKYWTSTAVNIGAEVMLDYASVGMRPPAYVWRGHNHVIDDSGLRLPTTRTIFTPSFQLKTEYGYKVASNRMRSDIGGFIMDSDRLDDTHCRYEGQPDGRRIIYDGE